MNICSLGAEFLADGRTEWLDKANSTSHINTNEMQLFFSFIWC